MAMLWVGTRQDNMVAIEPDPSELDWGLQDVSSPDAGRTHDANATMQKEYITSKRKLKLGWNNPTTTQASRIIRAFRASVYVYVRYWDIEDDDWRTSLFYTGDMSAPFRWFNLPGRDDSKRVSKLSFDIIER